MTRWANNTKANAKDRMKIAIPVRLTSWMGRNENPVIRFRLSVASRNRLYFDSPSARALCATRISVTRRAKEFASAGMKAAFSSHSTTVSVIAQHASVVVHRDADDQRREPIVKLRGMPAPALVMPIFAPSAHDIVARV